MQLNTALIRQKLSDAKLTETALAKALKVSRQSVAAWLGGQVVPRGENLIDICKALQITPNELFLGSPSPVVTTPLHRTVRKKAVSEVMRTSSLELAKGYLNLFRSAPKLAVVPVVRLSSRSEESAQMLAEYFRKLSGIGENKPMDYKSALYLLSQLGIFAVFRKFPEEISKDAYAFYSRIADHRVVFINSATNVLDLIFQLLHESVHAMRDEDPSVLNTKEEEEFCDRVAELAQFPKQHVDSIGSLLKTIPPTMHLKILTESARSNHHSLWGIYYRLKHAGFITEMNIGAAATMLSKQASTCDEILFSDSTPRHFVMVFGSLSPLFLELVKSNSGTASHRKIGEWLGLEASLDVQEVLAELNLSSTYPL